MSYTCHSLPWLAFQPPSAMSFPSDGLQKYCYVTAIVCCCHHNQYGLNFHSFRMAVLLCLYSLPPFFASDASSSKGALLGEHSPCKPREEGRPCGRHMGQVEHNFGGFPEIKQHSIGFVDDYIKFGFVWEHRNCMSLCLRRCDKLLFMSTATDERIGSIALPDITNGRASLWNKTKKVQKTYLVSLILSHYPRHLFMFGNTTETRQIGS